MAEKLSQSVERRKEFMLDIVDRLGERAWELINLGGVTMQRKPDGSKVTSVDLDLNRMFNASVRRVFPGDYVQGEEENMNADGISGRPFVLDAAHGLWTIDPIDKTNSFWRDYNNHHFEDSKTTVQVAWFAPGESLPSLSIIAAPFHDLPSQLMADPNGAYYRTKAAPAFRPVHVQQTGPISVEDVSRYVSNYWTGALPGTEFPEQSMPYARRVHHPMAYAAVALCDADLGIFPGSHPRDVAPNAHIVHKAGGAVRTLQGDEYTAVDWRAEPVPGLVTAHNEALAIDYLRTIK